MFGLLAGPPASRSFSVGVHYLVFCAGLLRDVTGAAPVLAAVGFLGLALGTLVATGRVNRQASPAAAAARSGQ